MKICFATRNEGKLKEVQHLLPDSVQLVSLNDLNHTEELEESFETLEENARQKAEFIYNTYKLPCFADDTGLEVKALNGAPGVHSAHFSGQRDPDRNIDLLLQRLAEKQDRSARFRTVIMYKDHTQIVKFEGIVTGAITTSRQGAEGFGYDPVFRPDGYSETFAEMELAEKNKISHRARAVDQLVQYLTKLKV